MRSIIDIGTNSIRLLVADKDEKGEWKVLKKELRSTRLGEGMTDKAFIGAGPQERTLVAIEDLKKIAQTMGCNEILGYGTSIMRDAGNGKEFAHVIYEKTGVPVKILSGKEEAYYSYIGAAGTSGVVTSVIDIGGGSTEICMGFGTDIGMRHSFPLGCVRCSKQFDTTTVRGIAELKKHCFELFRSTDLMEQAKGVKHWIGVGGTITSLASILQEMKTYDSSKVQGYLLYPDRVADTLDTLFNMSYDERREVTGLMPERADIIVAGLAILDSLMEYFALTSIVVSDRDLSEGLLDEDILSDHAKK